MATTKKATKKARIITKAEKEERKEKFNASAYNQNVNVVNRETKQYTKSIKGARTQLLATKMDGMNSLPEKYAKVLRASKKSELVWKHMQDNVRFYKSAKTGAVTGTGTHALLQYLYKYESELKEMIEAVK